MNFLLPSGVWPTMVTPYTQDGALDHEALTAMVEWYLANGVSGLFAVCQSSEMFYLNRAEQVELAAAVVTAAGGRCSVIASGHVSESPEQQIADVECIAATGVDAVVLLTNRFSTPEDPDTVWFRNAEKLLNRIDPAVPLGMYECPYPYPKLLSIPMLTWMAETGRFHFLKDTCCSEAMLKERAQHLAGGPLKLYNAHSASLLHSLQWGYAGFSGVMANFHPALYRWLFDHFESSAESVQKVQDFLGFSSVVEHQCYPVNAKYHLQLSGVPMHISGRTPNAVRFDAAMATTIKQLKRLTEDVTRWYT